MVYCEWCVVGGALWVVCCGWCVVGGVLWVVGIVERMVSEVEEWNGCCVKKTNGG